MFAGNQITDSSQEIVQALREKTFGELSDELFAMGDGKGQEDLMDLYAQVMLEKCPPDDGTFDFDAALKEVQMKIQNLLIRKAKD